MKRITLYYKQGGADKVYRAAIEKREGGHLVTYAYILNGVQLDVSERSGHYLIGTDGRRLFSANSFSLPLSESLTSPKHKLLAWRGVADLPWALVTSKTGDRTHVCVIAGNWTLTMKALDGVYPNWRQVVPRAAQQRTTVTRDAERDLRHLTARAVGQLGERFLGLDRRVASYKSTGVDDARAHDMVTRTVDAAAITPAQIPDVLKLWRKPDTRSSCRAPHGRSSTHSPKSTRRSTRTRPCGAAKPCTGSSMPRSGATERHERRTHTDRMGALCQALRVAPPQDTLGGVRGQAPADPRARAEGTHG